MNRRTELQQLKEELSQLKADLQNLRASIGQKPKTELEQIKEDMDTLKEELKQYNGSCPEFRTKYQELKEQRIRFNEGLLRKLSEYIAKYPDIRFGQALVNLKIINSVGGRIQDPFYEEPYDTFMRLIVHGPK